MRRIVRLLVKLYPRRWRERYGAEFDALLEQSALRRTDLLDVLGGAILMHWTLRTTGILIPSLATAGLLFGFAASFALPAHYRSEAVIRLPLDPDSANAMPRLAQDALRRNRLAELIRQEGLYEPERQRLPLEDIVEIIRRDTAITLDPKVQGQVRVAFSSADARTSQVVAAGLSRLLLAAGAGPAAGFEPLKPPSVELFRPYRWTLPIAGLCCGLLFGLTCAFIKGRKESGAAPLP